MKQKQAAEYFHGKEGYNCVQAVLKAYQSECQLTDKAIDSAAAFGGGRVAGGTCGTLYAAQVLLGESEALNTIAATFVEKNGSTKCCDLKHSEEGCRGYVAQVAELLTDHINHSE